VGEAKREPFASDTKLDPVFSPLAITMKSWLRLTLITVTVGGGFTGVALTLQLFLRPSQPLAYYLLMLAFLALFAFITVSGLVFVHNPQRTDLLIVALGLQIPWVSSPVIAYKLAAGFQVCIALIAGRFAGGFRLGSDFQINVFQRLPWGAGVNLFALALLVLLLRAERMTHKALQPTAATLGNATMASNTVSSTSATPPSGGGC
jgi:hypothetical protein